jgi:hypothetical protein
MVLRKFWILFSCFSSELHMRSSSGGFFFLGGGGSWWKLKTKQCGILKERYWFKFSEPVSSLSPNGSALHVVMHADMDCVCRLGEDEIPAETEPGEPLVWLPGSGAAFSAFPTRDVCRILPGKDNWILFQNGLVGIVTSAGLQMRRIRLTASPTYLCFL